LRSAGQARRGGGEGGRAGLGVLEVEGAEVRADREGDAGDRREAGGVGVERPAGRGGGEVRGGGGGDVRRVRERVLRLDVHHRRADAGDQGLGRGENDELRRRGRVDRLRLRGAGEPAGRRRQSGRARLGVL